MRCALLVISCFVAVVASDFYHGWLPAMAQAPLNMQNIAQGGISLEDQAKVIPYLCQKAMYGSREELQPLCEHLISAINDAMRVKAQEANKGANKP